ncbi:MAG TPA: hypothetical protein HPP76_08880 [Desulfuromonadales bacterium]|nr:hypothetical protein [Desulfuromonadales bacterium]
MSKVLLGVFVGVFVGAFTYELINKLNPELVRKFEAKASEKINDILETENESVVQSA